MTEAPVRRPIHPVTDFTAIRKRWPSLRWNDEQWFLALGIAPEIMDRLAHRFETLPSLRRPGRRTPPRKSTSSRTIDVRDSATKLGLDARQSQVLTMISWGMKAVDIATQLGVTDEVIRTLTRLIYIKLGVHTSKDAVVIAVREGVI